MDTWCTLSSRAWRSEGNGRQGEAGEEEAFHGSWLRGTETMGSRMSGRTWTRSGGLSGHTASLVFIWHRPRHKETHMELKTSVPRTYLSSPHILN